MSEPPPAHRATPVAPGLAPTPGVPVPLLAAPGLPVPGRGRRRGRPRERVPAWLAIVHKDVEQSRWALLVGCTWACGVVTLGTALSLVPPQVASRFRVEALLPGSPEAVLRAFALLGLLPVAWLLARRGVLLESRRGAWEALQHLPVRTGVVLAAKAVHGVSLMLFLAVLGGMLVAAGSGWNEAFDDARTLATLGVTTAFALGSYALLFFAAAWGRWRLLALGGVAGLAVVTGLGPRAPGMMLLSEVLTAEQLPRALRAIGLALGLLLLTVVLASRRGFALLRASSGPLRVTDVARAGWIGLLCLGVAALRRPPPPAVHLDPPVLRPALPVELEVGGFRPAERAQAEELAAAVGADLQALGELGLKLPPVAIEVARDCEPSVFRRAALRGARGVVVLAPYTTAGFARDDFRRWLIDEVVVDATGTLWETGWGRLLRDGLARWRVGLGPHDASRAAYALSDPTPRWRERQLEASSARALLQLARRAEEDELPPSDALDRALAGCLLVALDGCTSEGAGEPASVQAWLEAALRERPARRYPDQIDQASMTIGWWSPGLTKLPRITSWQLAATPEGALRAEVAPVGSFGAWALVHGASREDEVRDERLDGGRDLTTDRTYAPGTRVRCTLWLRVEELDCEVRVDEREVRIP
ncbi:MAG: hypothetical protein AB7N76_15885 [Planctomycetota bacterium]